MEHQIKLQPQYYQFILTGTKRIELRLYDAKRQQMQVGDSIKILKEPDLQSFFQAEIIGLFRYNTFAELVQDFDISELADKSMTKEQLLTELATFYPQELEQQYGVLGIQLKVK